MKIHRFLIFIAALGAMAIVASAGESEPYLVSGNKFYQDYINTGNKELLDAAYLNYYKAAKLEPSASSYLGMGMVFIEKKMNSQAKKYLYKAYCLDENDPVSSYYLGKFSYENEDFIKALKFYKKAYENGFSEDYETNLKLASIYEKLGDTNNAKIHYQLALKLNPASEAAQAGLNAIGKLDADIIKYFLKNQ